MRPFGCFAVLITEYADLPLLIHVHPNKILKLVIRPVVIRID